MDGGEKTRCKLTVTSISRSKKTIQPLRNEVRLLQWIILTLLKRRGSADSSALHQGHAKREGYKP